MENKEEKRKMAMGLYTCLLNVYQVSASWSLIQKNRAMKNTFINACELSLQRIFSIDFSNFFTDESSGAISVPNYLKKLKKGTKADIEIHKELSNLINDKVLIEQLKEIRNNAGAHTNLEILANIGKEKPSEPKEQKNSMEVLKLATKIYRIIEKHELGMELPIEITLEKINSDYQKLQIN